MTEKRDFTLYFPVKFDLTKVVPNPNGNTFTYQGQEKIDIQLIEDTCIFKISSLESEKKAEKCYERLKAGLIWLMLNRAIPFQAIEPLQEVVYRDFKSYSRIEKSTQDVFDPIRQADGSINGNQPAIYPSDRKIVKITLGTIKASVCDYLDNVFPYIEQGMTAPNGEAVLNDPKLKTALEIFNSHFRETSIKAKFLMLIIVLESLSEDVPKRPIIQEVFDSVEQIISERLGKIDPQSEDYRDLRELQQQMVFKRYKSIRQNISSLISNTLSQVNDPEAKSLGESFKLLYDARSALVHDGTAGSNLLELYDKAILIVNKVLKAKFTLTAGMPIPPKP